MPQKNYTTKSAAKKSAAETGAPNNCNWKDAEIDGGEKMKRVYCIEFRAEVICVYESENAYEVHRLHFNNESHTREIIGTAFTTKRAAIAAAKRVFARENATKTLNKLEALAELKTKKTLAAVWSKYIAADRAYIANPNNDTERAKTAAVNRAIRANAAAKKRAAENTKAKK